MPQQARQSLPPCQADLSLDLLRSTLTTLHSAHNKLKRRVVVLDQQQEENLDKLQELQLEIVSHDAKFQQIEECGQNMITEAQELKGLLNQRDAKLTEQFQFQTEFQIQFCKHFDDHKKR